MELVICRIISVDALSGHIYVRPIDVSVPNDGFKAYIASPIPFDSGGGLKSLDDSNNTLCLCARNKLDFYIIGFLQPRGPLARDTSLATVELQAGETRMGHKSGSFLSFVKTGLISLFAHPWAQIIIDPIKYRLLAKFQNIFLHLYSGFISYEYNLEKNTGLFSFEIKKSADLSMIDNKKNPSEKINFQLGTNTSNDHILEMNIYQDVKKDKSYDYQMNWKLGEQRDGVVLYGRSLKGNIETTIEVGNDGRIKIKSPEVIDLNSKTISLHSDEESLAKLLKDLLIAIQKITVATPSGNSFPTLINASDFTQLTNRLEKYIV